MFKWEYPLSEITVERVELADEFVDVREEMLACVFDSRALDVVGQLGVLGHQGNQAQQTPDARYIVYRAQGGLPLGLEVSLH